MDNKIKDAPCSNPVCADGIDTTFGQPCAVCSLGEPVNADGGQGLMSEVKLQLQPFSVPNVVIVQMPPRPRQDGLIEAPKFALAELDKETLEELCADFRASVMKKAGKD